MSRTGDNIFKRKDGRWEGRYIKFYENGKAKYGYVYARTYSETKAKLLTAIRNNTEESNKEYFNFKYWLDYWLKLSKLRVKESTYVKYKNQIQNHIEPELGCLSMSEITTIKIDSFINEKLNVLSPKSVSELLIIIKDSMAVTFHADELCFIIADDNSTVIVIDRLNQAADCILKVSEVCSDADIKRSVVGSDIDNSHALLFLRF